MQTETIPKSQNGWIVAYNLQITRVAFHNSEIVVQ